VERTKVLEMLEEIHRTGGDDKYLAKAKDKMIHSVDGIRSQSLQKFRSKSEN
jgi:hypothetical protein